jgi:hypothetical protein
LALWWAAGAVIGYGEGRTGLRENVPAVAAAGALAVATSQLLPRLERRRARDLGLTRETAPIPHTDCVTPLVQLVAWRAYMRLRGPKVKPPPWHLQLARRLIMEIERRRSFNAALRGPGR